MNHNDRIINALQHRIVAYQQSKNAALMYVMNWAAVLGTAVIESSTWLCLSNGVTVANAAASSATASAILSGQPGNYKVVNKIVTDGGETDERVISLTILDNDQMGQEDYE